MSETVSIEIDAEIPEQTLMLGAAALYQAEYVRRFGAIPNDIEPGSIQAFMPAAKFIFKTMLRSIAESPNDQR